ncbi:MAG: alpha/beta hydrolase-fold protein [Candidatus Jordarchaeum sp.]|uniref:alpha/beta hydrolase-fold protein n=1 Tax=Candidatus Jordarchaeum sp. TaxID=2823881 RepID=UPI00404B2132
MSGKNASKRYRVDNIHVKSLENNPINSPVDRELYVYLPPGYFESKDRRYPVVVYLHGYTGNNQKMTVVSTLEDNKNLPVELIPPEILEQIDLDRILSYAKLDEMITKGKLDPFIFVQPDGSLHLPHKDGAKDFTGAVQTKGSFFLNSPYTGNFEDYIVKDVIEYVDANYRTIPDKQHRALMGGSMGGYGTLSICLHHPEKFVAAAALSPANITIDLLDWKLVTPIYEKLLGREIAEQLGASTYGDIMDTFDILFSKDNPLMPTVKRDKSGKIVKWDKKAANNWQKYDINYMIRKNPNALKKVQLLINCESTDEYGLTDETKKIHKTLEELEIKHQFEVYSDPKAALSPHILGIAYQIIPGIKFCTQYFT